MFLKRWEERGLQHFIEAWALFIQTSMSILEQEKGVTKVPELMGKDYSKDIHGNHYFRNVMFAMILIGTFAGMLDKRFCLQLPNLDGQI
ncbi:hypothetical protein ICE98_00249 [Lactococcus lactis]|nr:hypothetical protein [Lactococcus lactis]